MRTALVVAIFCLTYALIAARRLRLLPIGRPAGALLGAVLMVAVGALSPAQSFGAIDADTILLLFSMMLLAAQVEDAGVLGSLDRPLRRLGSRPRALLVGVSLASAGLSAVLVNDTVCLFLTPLVVRVCVARRLALGPYLIAVATSANIGSAATLVGNPQNMLIGGLSGIGFATFAAQAGPAALAALAVNMGLLVLFYGRRLTQPGEAGGGAPPAVPCVVPAVPGPASQLASPWRRRVTALVLGGVLGGLLAGGHMGFVALGGAMVLLVVAGRDGRAVLARLDWPLLVLFCGLFVVVDGLTRTGLVATIWSGAAPLFDLDTPFGAGGFTAFVTAGCNIVSNVPLVLLVGPYVEVLGAGDRGWVLLAFASTVAGNLTLLGSVANIIVAETARDAYDLGYREYLRFGVVSTAAALAVGVPIVLS